MRGEIYNIADMETSDKGATAKLRLRPAWRVVWDTPRVWRSHRDLLRKYNCASPGWTSTKLTACLWMSWVRARCFGRAA